MKLSEVAFKAAEIMSERGHCKRVLEDGDGRVCFNGALQAALTGNPRGWGDRKSWLLVQPVFFSVSITAADILRQRDYSYSGDPVDYNNAEETTGEDVISLLKEAGHRLEAEGR